MKQDLYSALFFRWQKLTGSIQKMYADGRIKKLPFKTRISLFKRLKRYTKKLLSANNSLVKALNVFCIAMASSLITNAQCDTFKLSDGNNPLKNVSFTPALSNPSFVDIDNDGDLDCYEVYQTAKKKGGYGFPKK